MNKDNHFIYKTTEGHCKGFFNIYQDRAGALRLLLGASHTKLIAGQILELNIDVHQIPDFDYDQFLTAYPDFILAPLP
jgi:hypothetical protein